MAQSFDRFNTLGGRGKTPLVASHLPKMGCLCAVKESTRMVGRRRREWSYLGGRLQRPTYASKKLCPVLMPPLCPAGLDWHVATRRYHVEWDAHSGRIAPRKGNACRELRTLAVLLDVREKLHSEGVNRRCCLH